jgi:hypothetical protein
MFEKRIPVGDNQRLMLVEMASTVTLAGWEEAEILVRLREGREEDLAVEMTEEGPALSAKVACQVHVPAALPVKIRQALSNLDAKGLRSDLEAEQIMGNLRIQAVDQAVIAEVYGNLKADDLASLRLVGTTYGDASLKGVQAADLQNIRGNLQARGLGQLRVSRISGNLQAKAIAGTLAVDKVGANAVLKEIGGPVVVDQVAGNCTAKNLTAGARIARVGGNLVLHGPLGSGSTYHFQVDGNAVLGLSEEDHAHLTLRPRGRFASTLPLTDHEEGEDGTISGTLGAGGAEVAVEAKGNIVLGSGRPTAGPELGDEVSRQVQDSLRAIDLEAIGRQVGEEMEAAMSRLRVKLESVDWERVGGRAQEAAERAMEQMQRDLNRWAEKAARRQEWIERRAEREARRMERWERRFEARARQPQAEGFPAWAQEDSSPVGPGPNLDEERLSILRMVEQGQITPQEAEMLLDALD